MTSRDAAPTTVRRTRIRRTRAAGLLVALAALAVILGHQLLPASLPSMAATPLDVLRGDHQGSQGAGGGQVPEGTTVFDDDLPAVAKLDSDLLAALREAATDAANDGVELVVNSGWRSPAYQRRLLREAVSTYGSEAEAARWVATPDTSPHVSGDAVDVGPFEAQRWLSEHGARYGLCRIYDNEPWHYELRPDAVGHGCPETFVDPTHDPRLQP